MGWIGLAEYGLKISLKKHSSVSQYPAMAKQAKRYGVANLYIVQM